jgi:cell division protein FtsL
MNTAARAMNQGVLSRDWIVSVFLTKAQVMVMLLSVATLISALSVIYAANRTRSLNAELQQTFAEREHAHEQWSQLLLEKSMLITQARVQNIATSQLDMAVPNQKSVVVVRE